MSIKKIEVYETPDGKLFKTKRGYDSHVKKLKKEAVLMTALREEQQAKNKEYKEKGDMMRSCRLLATSLDDYFDRCREYFTKYFAEFEIEFFVDSIRFSECVSNSHAKPVDGVCNWSARDKSKPTSYPGWTGSIFIFQKYGKPVVTKSSRSIPPEAFGPNGSIQGLTTGTGGHRRYDGRDCRSYDVKMYLQDFPLIEARRKQYEEAKSLVRLLTEDRDAHTKRVINGDDQVKSLRQEGDQLEDQIDILRSELNEIQQKTNERIGEIKQDVAKAFPIDTSKLEILRKDF